MSQPILICSDDSPGAVRAIEAAAALLSPRRAVLLDVLPWMTASSTWEGIVDVADELDAALIVIGSREQTGVKTIFDASVSQQVAEHAGRPVLIVPPPR